MTFDEWYACIAIISYAYDHGLAYTSNQFDLMMYDQMIKNCSREQIECIMKMVLAECDFTMRLLKVVNR